MGEYNIRNNILINVEQVDALEGTEVSEVITSHSDDEQIIFGARGDDVLVGQINDRYVIRSGDGNDQIVHYGSGGIVEFIDSYSISDFEFKRISDDLIVERHVGSTQEALVNTFTSGSQHSSSVASLLDGGYIITWTHSGNIYLQRFDKDEKKIGGEVTVNTDTTLNHSGSSALALPDGGYVVVWFTSDYGSRSDVYMQRYDAQGNPIGEQNLVNTTTDLHQRDPSIASFSDGGFTISWTSDNQDGSSTGIYLQNYDSQGNKIGEETLVNSTTEGSQWSSAVTQISDGGYVVTWSGQNEDRESRIYSQRFDENGTAVGAEREFSSASSSRYPVITALEDGGYVIAWEGGTYQSIYLQRFDADGQEFGVSTKIETILGGAQTEPQVTALSDGGYIVTWTNSFGDGSGKAIYLQRFDVNGNKIGAEKQINDFYRGNQFNTSVELLADDSYVVSWTSSGQDGSSLGVYKKRYYPREETVIKDYFSGSDRQVELQLSDGTVIPVGNLEPVVSGSLDRSVDEYGVITITAAELLSNVSDDGFASLSVANLSLSGIDAELTEIASGGEWQIKPGPNQHGAIVLSYEVVDGEYRVANSLSLTVEAVNDLAGTVGSDALVSDDAVDQIIFGDTGDDTLTGQNGDHYIIRYGDGADRIIHTGTGGVVQFEGLLSSDDFTFKRQGFDLIVELGGATNHALQERQVNTYTENSQEYASVTALVGGGFVVVWQSQGQDGSKAGIYGQRFDAVGNSVGDEFQINGFVTDYQTNASVVALLDGSFAVAWNSRRQDGSFESTHLQRFDSSGNSIGEELLVNSYTLGNQNKPSITSLFDGGFVVVWQSQGQDGSGYGVFSQRYNKNGEKVGAEKQINSFMSGDQSQPVVEGLSDGGFIVVWQSRELDGSSGGIFSQRFDSSGEAIGEEVKVNSYAEVSQHTPTIAVLEDGGYIVSWTSYGQDGSQDGVYLQRFDKNGLRIGAEEQVNNYTYYHQSNPDIVGLENGGYVVVWDSWQDAPQKDGGPDADQLSIGVYSKLYLPKSQLVVQDYFVSEFDQVEFQISDGTLLSVEIPNESAFVSGSLDRSVDEYGVITITAAELLSNVSDDGVASLSVANLSLSGIDAELTEIASGEWQIKPGANQYGAIVLSYEVVDGEYRVANSLSLTVEAVNDLAGTVGSDALVSDGAVDQIIFGDAGDDTLTGQNGDRYIIRSGDGIDRIVHSGAGGVVEFAGVIHPSDFTFRRLGDDLEVSYNGSDADKIVVQDYFTGSDRQVELRLSDGTVVPVPDLPEEFNDGQIEDEIQVNSTTLGDQRDPSITTLADGGYVVAWAGEDQESSVQSIYLQRYNAEGSVSGPEMKMSHGSGYYHGTPSVAALSDGGYVLTWVNISNPGERFVDTNVYLQRFDSQDNAIGVETLVNTSTYGFQYNSDVVELSDGGYVVVWQGHSEGHSKESILLQRYDVQGNVVGQEVSISEETGTSPAVAALDNGEFVIVWTQSSSGVYQRRYDDQGIPITEKVQVIDNSYGASVATLSDGGYVVVWESHHQDGDSTGVYLQRYDAEGNKVDGEIQVNDRSDGGQSSPVITALQDGGFVVSWESQNQDGDGYGIYSKRFESGSDSVPSIDQNPDLALSEADSVDSVTSHLAHDFGVDGAGNISLTSVVVPDGFIARQETDGSFTILQNNTAVLTVMLDVNGEYTVARIDEIFLNSNQSRTFEFDIGYAVTDADGDSVNGHAGFNVEVSGDFVGNGVGIFLGVDHANAGMHRFGRNILEDNGTSRGDIIDTLAGFWVDGDEERNELHIDDFRDDDGVITTTDKADFVYGDTEDNVINLAAGNDFFDERSRSSGSDTVSGGKGNDRIWSGDGNDRLFGGDGNDRLSGETGNDFLSGDRGNDVLTGGSGEDTFFFKGQINKDRITDFMAGEGAGDTLHFEGYGIADFDDLLEKASQDGDDVLITLNDKDSIRLEDVDITALHSDDFEFV